MARSSSPSAELDANEANLTCRGCSKTFGKPSARLQHQKKSKNCRWLADLHDQLEPTPLHDYRDYSDLEDDPPSPSGDNNELITDDDVFSLLADTDHPPARSSTPAATPTLSESQDAPSPLPSRPNMHDPESRAEAEKVLDEEPVTSVAYKGAGRILRFDKEVQAAYKKQSKPPRNPYHPFKNATDWAIARWAKDESVSQNAFSKLLAIPEVRRLHRRHIRSTEPCVCRFARSLGCPTRTLAL